MWCSLGESVCVAIWPLQSWSHGEAQQHKQHEMDELCCWGRHSSPQIKSETLGFKNYVAFCWGKADCFVLFCQGYPGCSFQAEISAKSNRCILHWEHPPLPQRRCRFTSGAQMLMRLLPALHVQQQDVTSGEHDGNRICSSAVELSMHWLLD